MGSRSKAYKGKGKKKSGSRSKGYRRKPCSPRTKSSRTCRRPTCKWVKGKRCTALRGSRSKAYKSKPRTTTKKGSRSKASKKGRGGRYSKPKECMVDRKLSRHKSRKIPALSPLACLVLDSKANMNAKKVQDFKTHSRGGKKYIAVRKGSGARWVPFKTFSKQFTHTKQENLEKFKKSKVGLTKTLEKKKGKFNVETQKMLAKKDADTAAKLAAKGVQV